MLEVSSACAMGLKPQPLSVRLPDGIGFLQRSSARHPHSAPCGVRLPHRGGISGLPCFAPAAIDELAPASTPTAALSVCPHGVGGHPGCAPFGSSLSAS